MLVYFNLKGWACVDIPNADQYSREELIRQIGFRDWDDYDSADICIDGDNPDIAIVKNS